MKKEFPAIDLMKYICSILVIIVHTSPLLPFYNDANFILIHGISRIAVPFFFISNGYFIQENIKRKDASYFATYIRALCKAYLIWSILYIPIGIMWIQDTLSLPWYLYPVTLIIAIFYSGTYYPLWYVPALIISLIFIQFLLKKGIKNYMLFIITSLLLCFGAIETYHGIMPKGFLLDLFNSYIKFFITTRNALFFGFFYVFLGVLISNKKIHISKYITLPMSILFLILSILEVLLLKNTDSLNYNIMLMNAPLVFFCFLYLKEVKLKSRFSFKKLREFSENYYFIHGFFLGLLPVCFELLGIQWLFYDNGMVRFCLVLFLTHVVSKIIYHGKKNNKKKDQYEKYPLFSD